MQMGGVFGPELTLGELEFASTDADLRDASTERDGGLAYFSAHKLA
jgi:hypothetical protein